MSFSVNWRRKQRPCTLSVALVIVLGVGLSVGTWSGLRGGPSLLCGSGGSIVAWW